MLCTRPVYPGTTGVPHISRHGFYWMEDTSTTANGTLGSGPDSSYTLIVGEQGDAGVPE